MSADVWQHGERVAVTQELISDASGIRTTALIQRGVADAFVEMLLDEKHGPRLGPRRVLNDEQQAREDRRQELANELLELADEWGVTDLVRGDE